MSQLQQRFNVTGLIHPQYQATQLRQLGAKLGRFDAANANYSPHYDGNEDVLRRTALAWIKHKLGCRLDAAESAFVSRALTAIDPATYATLIAPLEARTFIPTNVKGNPGDEFMLWRKYTRTGMARLFAPGAALDLPRASFYQEEIPLRFYPIGVEIVYNYFELLAIGAAVANGYPVDLIGESLRAAMEAIEKRLDVIAAFGTAAPPAGFAIEVEADVGLTGLLNNPNATVYTIPPGQAGSPKWADKTADEIYLDLNGIIGGQVASTFKIHRPDTILVPITEFETQLTRRMSDISNTTIIEFFQNTRKAMGNPVEVLSWMYMAGAGAGPSDLMVAYKRDPRMLEHVLAMDATPLPATTQGMETTQPVIAKTAGLLLRYPLSLSLAPGIG